MLKINGMLALILLCSLALTGAGWAAEEEPGTVPAVKGLSLAVNDSVYEDASRDEPLELKSSEDAKKYFSEEELKALNKAVDWDKQGVLIFAWHGSGGDKLEADVKEAGDGLLIEFGFTGGMTRDLRPHSYVYAVRKGVDWRWVDRGFGR